MRERKVYNGLQDSPDVKSGRCGSRFRDKMCPVVGKRGGRHLEKVGETDQYAIIQSYKDSVDLQKMIERCMSTGDVSILQKAQGIFTDISGLPCDARAAHDLVAKSRLVFEVLTPQQKIKYPTFDDFLEAFASQDSIMKFISDSAAPDSAVPEGGENIES